MSTPLSSDGPSLGRAGRSARYAGRRAGAPRRDFHVLAQLVGDGRRHEALVEAARQARTDRTFPALDARLLLPAP